MSETKEQPIQIALLGLGTVGGGVFKLMNRLREELPMKVGAPVEITRILVRNRQKNRPGIPAELLTDDFQEILMDPHIQIVVEVMGGIQPACSYILAALTAGKSVVTANKDLLAERGRELLEAAAAHQADLLFEASVAGGIPIIRPLKECLAGNTITEVMGIINGTTNYILTRMTRDGMEFSQALEQAQQLGYAEADPTADIEGYDAGRKMAIMASIAFHSRVTFQDVHTQGITAISARDIRYARELGCVIKLLGVARLEDAGIEVGVHPMLIPESHPLANVNDAFNAVFLHGDAVDDAMFMGRGAGEMPTASAVVGDIIDAARNLQAGCTGRIGCSCYKDLPIRRAEDCESRYFFRLQAEDRPGVLASIASVFGNNGVSIAQVIQKTRSSGLAELVIITDRTVERHFADSIAILKGMSMVKEISAIIRVYP